jgi:hypothetical protein
MEERSSPGLVKRKLILIQPQQIENFIITRRKYTQKRKI